MFARKSICIAWATCVLWSAGGVDVKGQNIIFSPEIVQTIENSKAHDAFWSVIVRDSTGNILDGYNFDKNVRPASNLKLLTSAMILNELEPNFTYHTKLYGVGIQAGNVWKGDIIIRGSGDPSISGTFYHKDRFHVFEKFYQALDSLGIKQIDGSLIGNDSYFDQQVYPKGWSWDDLSFYYGVEVNALSFNENAVDLRVYAKNRIGEKPDIEWFPFDTDYVDFVNEQIITPSNSEYDESYRRIMGTNTILLRSSLPQNYVEKESLSILDAPRFFVDTFKKYLEQGGIKLTEPIVVESNSRNWKESRYKVLKEHQSVSLHKLLEPMNKESNNFYAEMLLKTAAAEHYDTPGSTELGVSLIESFAESMDMNEDDLVLSDGSGLASSTLLKIEGLSKMMVKMRSNPYFKAYKNSLAIAGKDGTLEHRFNNTPVEGRLYGKSGYISGVRALSGYLEAASGQPLVVSVITNNYTESTSYIDSIQEEIVQKIYHKY
ncbi:D-alanyl-D-alanine carboxypeptidase/D-alanyl-D-alanine endopeptidase [Fodinibius salsisoli]|uniref:D-alanyl-D-alanine carboxypeptidase/D-alanyl-D-alanine-endopeptidase n=1 Tax=Fodinibius salsisoli TaxID=2820877 RepID=A0ABT3PL50_9BACT|nr:D-alanyl-D-alanine carboxypeptidase/D-alanyl-D-alanine-endopeptidase [Fodinibius salsisoli]MCW9706666.1 D-alanyl-D-alanine carboxypeptidase/D-alanyl-D-alanine-endopeptidase [Fodinibius salsisoli]